MGDGVQGALIRQARARLCGHSVVTLLHGHQEGACAAWRGAALAVGQRALVIETPTCEAAELNRILLDAVLPPTEWERLIDEYLQREARGAPTSLAHARALGDDELALALEQRGEVASLAMMVERVARRDARRSDLPLFLCEGDAVQTWEHIARPLLGDAPPPALALAAPTASTGWLDGAARWASAWVQRAPALPIALMTTNWNGRLDDPHVEALLREGEVRIPAPRVDEVMSTPDSREVAARDEAADAARSAAERFLFDCLEVRASTAGRFVLNGRLAASRELPSCEVDLVATDLQLAIEIDGYHHFREPEDYRRDRRKDLALQRRGFWVLRFLAADVVTQLEEILATIDAALAARQAGVR